MYQEPNWEQHNYPPSYQYQQQPPPAMGAFGVPKTTFILSGVVLTIVLLVYLYKTVQENHGETMMSLTDILAALPDEM